ncbi:M81 family metallopeptidase [Candidatus Thioglobus sp.]|nr:M81 family metallopeptidase [Candidatus Thioglobus sp.]
MALNKIAVGGISTECSTYSPLYQNESDFKSLQGQDLLDLIAFPFDNYGIETYPIFFNKSVPGGPIESQYFRQTKDKFIAELESLGTLDGVLLIMHGAIFVDNLDDPEGEWIEAVRDVVGEDCIVSVSFDLHGQMTNKIVNNIDAFAAYRTAPHVDVEETYMRASKMLADALTSNKRPTVLWSPIPVLVAGEMSSTFVEPCQSIYKNLELLDQRKGIIDTNLMVGYVWADTQRAVASAVVTCTNKKTGTEICQIIANLYWNSRHQLKFDMRSGDISASINSLPKNFSIIADSGDNPTAGGVGDRADVLEAVLNKKIDHVLFAGIASESAYNELQKGNEFNIGGSFGGGGPNLALNADEVYFKEQCAIAKVQNITIVVSKRRRPFHYLSDFDNLRLNLQDYRLLVVKSGYLSPDLQGLSCPSFMALSSGAVNQDLMNIGNHHRKKPTFPFQEFNEFVPEVSDGSNLLS